MEENNFGYGFEHDDYANVWWSLANEYDLMPHKAIQDWERYASILCEKDPLHERQWSYDNRLAENRRQAVLHECKWCMG